MSEKVASPVDLSHLSPHAPELAAAFASIASDLALVIDANGTIVSVSALRSPLGGSTSDWIGKKWVDTVTQETRRKVEMLLEEVRRTGVSQRREVNHPSASGDDIPIAYAAIQLGDAGPVLVAGRDLRAIAAIQQRFVQSQQEMERDYWLRRREETRYRLLFQVATDAVVVVDAESGRIVDANPAASNLLSVGRRELLGRSLKEDLGWQSPPAIAAMLAAALESNRGGEMPARLVGNAQPLLVSATPFRGLTDMLLLVRVRAAQGAEDNEPVAREDDDNDSAVVVTDSSGRILMSNQLFAQWCEVPGEASIRGESIGRWLDSISGGVPALLESVRARGISSETECVIVGKGRRTKKLMLSAALLTDEDQERIGFVLTRAVHALDDPPLSVASSSAGALEELVGQIGNTGLVDLVAAASAIVERSAIEHAWTRAVGDLDATARLLRISSTELQQRIGTLGIVLGAFGADVSTTSKSH